MLYQQIIWYFIKFELNHVQRLNSNKSNFVTNKYNIRIHIFQQVILHLISNNIKLLDECTQIIKYIQAEQQVMVTVIKGLFLVDVDEILGCLCFYKKQLEKGKMDPYAQIILQDQKFKTKVATNQGKTPLWKETFAFNYSETASSSLIIQVFDKDITKIEGNLLGQGSCDVKELYKEQQNEYTMLITKDGQKQGDVVIKLEYKGSQEDYRRSITKNLQENTKPQETKNKQSEINNQGNENTLNVSMIESIKEANVDDFQAAKPSKIRGSQFFLTDYQVSNEVQMKNARSLNKLVSKTKDTFSQVSDTNMMLQKLNASLSPDKSVTSLFMNSQKMYDPKKIQISGTNDSQLFQQFKSVNDYFDHIFQSQELNQKAIHEAEQITKESQIQQVQKIFKGETKLSTQIEELDEPVIMENEYEQIQALQERIIKKDIVNYEKIRKQVALKLVDLEPEYFGLRVDEYVERQKIEALRKQLTQKLLYIEDRIQALKLSQTIDNKNHHFSSNSNLHNSQLELSILTIQKDYVSQWEHDPEREKIRKEFIDRVMREWHEIQDKRVIKVREMEEELKKHEEHIKQLEEDKLKEINAIKRKEIIEYLDQLKIKQAERKIRWLESQINTDKIKQQQTLAQKYAAQDAKFFVDELEKRKNRMKQIKVDFQPQNFNLDSVNEHDKKFLEFQTDKATKRDVAKDVRAAEWTRFKAQYFSEFYKKAQEDVKITYNPQEDILKKAQLKIEKHKTMNKLVKEQFLPKIDQKKQDQMHNLIESSQHHSDFKHYQSVSDKVKNKRRYEGINIHKMKNGETKKSLHQVKPLDSIRYQASPKTESTARADFKSSQSPARSQEDKLPQITKYSSEARFSQKKDYLKEMREHKTVNKKDLLQDWERLTYNQKEGQKDQVNNLLMLQSKKMEKAAQQYEQLLRARNLSDNKLIDDEQEVNSMLVNSIKAKLYILERESGNVKLNKSTKNQNKKRKLSVDQERQQDEDSKSQLKDSYVGLTGQVDPVKSKAAQQKNAALPEDQDVDKTLVEQQQQDEDDLYQDEEYEQEQQEDKKGNQEI